MINYFRGLKNVVCQRTVHDKSVKVMEIFPNPFKEFRNMSMTLMIFWSTLSYKSEKWVHNDGELKY